MKSVTKTARGFTLIEILVVIGIIAILAAIVIIAINPAKQFAQARNSQRTANVNAILNAIGQRIADNKGVFEGAYTINTITYTCPTLGAIKDVDSGTGGTGIDLSCLVPTYIPALPNDPKYASGVDTLYTVEKLANSRLEVCAPLSASPSNEPALPDAPKICVTR